MKEKRMIITIGRECGSGGHEIGEKLEQHYGIKFYDRDIIDLLAEQSNEDPEKLAKLEEKVIGSRFPMRKGGFAVKEGERLSRMSKSDQLFMRERALIRKLAETESFVIVGRSANTILADDPDALHLFVYAPESFKLPRVKEYYHLNTDAEAKKKMEQVDKTRRDYVRYYSGLNWGSSEGHNFMIDSSMFGIDGTVDVIIGLVDKKFG